MAIGRVQTMRGVVGIVKWFPNGNALAGDHFNAAAIDGYTVTRTRENVWAVVGRVVLSDAYKLSQRPLMFVAPTKAGEFRWAIRSFEISGGVLRASLGDPSTS